MTTGTTKASAILADSLSQFSKAAYAFAEIENQSHHEVLRAVSEMNEAREETREVRAERDKAREEAADAKAALAQAKLTIAHQAENIARQAENIQSQHETNAELRREVTQWKDQSRDWQEHLFRVEEVRCAQSSLIEELLKAQYTRPITATIHSPTKPPSYKSAAPHRSYSDPSSPLPAKTKQTNQGITLKCQRNVPLENSSDEAQQTSSVVRHRNPISLKRKTKVNNSSIAAASSSQRQESKTPTASRTTLIRRVQAVVHVKREESDDDSAESLSATANMAKGDASDEDEIVDANPRRSSRRSRRVIKDDEDNYLAADGNPVLESKHLRHRNAIVNYREEDEEEDDEDELMMGAEENHEEVYGTQRVETCDIQRPKQQHPHPTMVVVPPPKKKRKLAAQ